MQIKGRGNDAGNVEHFTCYNANELEENWVVICDSFDGIVRRCYIVVLMLKILDGEINHADHVKQNWAVHKATPRATNGTSFNDKDEIIVGSCPGIKITLAVG